MLKNHVFGSLNLNNSEIFRLSFEDIFLGTLDTYTKKINPPSAVLGGGGVHGKVCWLIAYNNSLRRLLGISKYNSASEMFVQLNIKSFGELLRKYVFYFINRLTISDNSILVSICDSSVPIFSNIWNWWYDIVAL